MNYKENLMKYWTPHINEVEPIEHKEPAYDISVLIPVYNAMPYLEECIRSLLEQEIDNIKVEVICINNISTDNSMKYLLSVKDKLKDKFSNVTFGDCKVAGAAAARNMALCLSSGEHVLFVDADDKLGSKTYLKDLFTGLKENDADACLENFTCFNNERQVLKTITFGQGIKTDYKDFKSVLGYTPNKLIKRAKFEGINFPEQLWFEDSIIQTLVFPRCHKVVFLDKADYWYRIHENSLTSSKNSTARSLEAVWVADWVYKQARGKGILDAVDKGQWFEAYSCYFGSLTFNRIKKRPGIERRAAYHVLNELMKESMSYCNYKGQLRSDSKACLQSYLAWEIECLKVIVRKR